MPTPKTLLFLTILSPLAAVPATARAQLKPEIQTGSMIPVKPKAVDPKDAGLIRKHFAQCVYRSQPAKAAALLDHSDAVTVDLIGANIKDVGRELDMDRCLGNQAGIDVNALEYRFKATILRDLLAEEAYLARNRTAPALPSPVSPLAVRLASGSDRAPTAGAMTEFTDCAVRTDVAHADALLRTTPSSDQELAVARLMGPALGACLMQGQNVSLSAKSIRAFVAFGMWNRFARGVPAK